MIDVPFFYEKLANKEPVSHDEALALLREVCALRNGLAHLASCQAATLEDLPKSASKRQRTRHERICITASQVLEGDDSGIRYITALPDAKNRCMEAVTKSMLDFGSKS